MHVRINTHTRLAGSPIHAEVGDELIIVVKNMLPFPVDVEPSGLVYGEPIAVYPGQTVEYR